MCGYEELGYEYSCKRIGGCLKKTCGANSRCICDEAKERKEEDRLKHLEDIKTLNQNVRGK